MKALLCISRARLTNICRPALCALAPLREILIGTIVVGLITTCVAAESNWSDEDLRKQPGVESVEYLFEEAPYKQCHASTIVETPTGLVAAWFGGTHEKHPDVGIWLSRQEDGQWTPPVEIANGVQSPTLRYPTWNPVLFQVGPSSREGLENNAARLAAPTGPLLLFYKVGPSPRDWWGMITTSDDGGKTWSKPERMPDGILGPIKNKPVRLSNGDILAGSSTESNQDDWRVHFERSADGGKTWNATPPVNDGRTITAIQPSILLHDGGRLQAVGRTRNGRVFEIWSDDDGKTWGPMSLTKLPNPSSGTDAVTLADGGQLLVYNHLLREQTNIGKSRGTLNVAISDDGRDWNAAAVLERSDGEYSYPAVIQTADGLVHVTYTWKRDRIKHVVIDPAKLRLTPIVDGKWPEN